MSWEYSKHEARCENCGQKGFRIHGSNDWFQSVTWYEGFKNLRPDPTAVSRKRTGNNDHTPICKCGSSRIVTGEYICGIEPFRS